MYLRQSNKWNDFLIQEAIEQAGLPLEIVAMIRDANSTDGPVPEKVLTSIGTLARSYAPRGMPLLDITTSHWASELKNEIPQRLLEPLNAFLPTPDQEEHNYNLLDINRFRKSYVKMLKRAGFTAQAEKINELILEHMKLWTQDYVMRRIRILIKLYVEDPTDYKEAISYASKRPEGQRLADAARLANSILDREQEDPDKLLHKFDNGYYWYDIRSSACHIEATQMGHCGQGANEGNLYSLRSPSGTPRSPDPHVTIEMDADKTVWQVKGRANMVPKKKYWPYISWFLVNMGATSYRDLRGAASKGMIEYLEKASPDIFKQSFLEYAEETGDDWEEATIALLELDEISTYTMNVSAPFDLAGSTMGFGGGFGSLKVDYALLYQADLPDEYQDSHASLRVAPRQSATFKNFRKLKDSLESNFIAKHFSSEIFGVTPKVRVSSAVVKDHQRLAAGTSERANALETKLTWHFKFEVPTVDASTADQEQAKKAFDANIKNANKLVNHLRDVEKGYSDFEQHPGAIEGFDLDGFEMDLQNFYDSKGLAKKEPEKQFDMGRVTERWSKIVK